MPKICFIFCCTTGKAFTFAMFSSTELTFYRIILGGFPKSLPVIDAADEKVKQKVTYFRTVCLSLIQIFYSIFGVIFKKYRAH